MEKLKTTNIRGKEYVEVSTRLEHFRKHFPQHSLQTEVVHLSPEEVVMVARIYDANSHLVATGHAHEDKSSSRINQTSYVENCETSAWGRALGAFGIGLNGGVASAEEVDLAIKKQDASSTKPSLTLEQEVASRLNGAAEEVNAYLRSVGWLAEGQCFSDLDTDRLTYIKKNASSLLEKAKAHRLKGQNSVRKAVAASVGKAGA